MADGSDEENEVFADAEEGDEEADTPPIDQDGLLPEEEVTSDKTIEDVRVGEDLFLNNNFLEAQALFQAKSKRSLYHSLGYSTILSVRAVMTMEHDDISAAYDQLKKTVQLSSIYRRKQSFLGAIATMVKGGQSVANLKSLTKNQLHAELIYAESVFLKAAISVLNDEGFVSLIKSGVNIRASWLTFKNCLSLWQEGKDKNDVAASPHFTSGVALGAGGFNLLLSLMPSKLLKIIEFVGFSGSRETGLELLSEGAASAGLRSPLNKLLILGFHLVLGSFLELPDVNLDEADKMLQSLVEQFPQGALTLYFQGKMYETKREATQAVAMFEKAISAQLVWQQLHHICYWELVWCHCFLLEWENGAKYAERLLNENKWSKSVYAYLQASFLLMNGDSDKVFELMKQVPEFKQKIAGKSLPVEKFVIRKARKYLQQGRHLVLPAIEIAYCWGFVRLLGDTLPKALDLVTAEVNRLREESKTKDFLKPQKKSLVTGIHYADDFLLTLLLQATIYREMKEYAKSEAAFQELLVNEAALTLDQYIAPYARMEHARLLIDQEKWSEAKEELNVAISKYDHFSNQGRLRLRVHVLTQQVDEILAK